MLIQEKIWVVSQDIDSLLLKDYLDNNADFSKLFKVSKVSAYKHLKKLCYSYKKALEPLMRV